MDKLAGLFEDYNTKFGEASLFISLSDIQFKPSGNVQKLFQIADNLIEFNGIQACCSVTKNFKISRHLQNYFDSVSWLPIFPLNSNFAETLFFQKHKNLFIFKFSTPQNSSVSSSDFIKTLFSCLKQTIPNFGAVIHAYEIQLPFAFIGEAYIHVEIFSKNSLNINVFGNFRKLGNISSLNFEDSENSKIIISTIETLFKKPININLDQTLWRAGLDSLKIATLEFKLKSIFEEASELQHGFCMKLESIRQLLEIFYCLTLKSKSVSEIEIEKCDWIKKMEKLPITEAQKQLIFLCKTKNGDDFCEEFLAKFKIPLNPEKLKNALTQILGFNPSLKVIFSIDHSKILPSEEALIIFDDKNAFDSYQFDMFSKPSIIFFIKKNSFSIKFHHILLDGKSLQLFVKQLMAFYNGKKPTANPNYFDFAIFESQFLAKTDFSKELKYWISKFSKLEDFPKLPKESISELIEDSSGSIISINFPDSLAARFHAFVSSKSCTLFAAFLAFYRFFIYKLYGFPEFLVLISIDNRLNEKFEETIGLFVNLATVSFTLDPSESFEKLLNLAQTDLKDSISHGRMPYNKVISALRHQNSSDPEIPEVMLVHDFETEENMEGVEIVVPETKKFIQNSQIWYLKEMGGTLNLQIEFRKSMFPKKIMKNQAERFLISVEKVLLNPNMPLKSFDLLTEKEVRDFLEFRNSLSHPVPVISPIELIWNQLRKNPAKKIVKSENEEMASEILMEKTLIYAEKIKALFEEKFQKRIPSRDQPIALLLQRSMDLIVMVLASWHLNLAPIMITRDWPKERIAKSLTGFQDLILITDNEEFLSNNEIGNAIKVIILIQEFQNYKFNINPYSSFAISSPSDLAYLTFTSGSTGIPKAVQSIQRGLINLWQSYTHYFSITSNSTIYQVVNPAFDIFFADIISAFGNGAFLFLASQKIPKMSELRHCSHAYIMPSYLSQLDLGNPEILEILKNLKAILYGGEPINETFLKSALNNQLNLFQQFGVTEHSIYSNFLSPQNNSKDRLVVGQNFENFHGYLVDFDGQRLPPINLGVQGWFQSAGIAVARGYAFGTESQNLVFGSEEWDDGWRFFDSGDRMKYLQSGDDENPWNCHFSFCGRTDSQIKIRGNRVEISDVEEPFRTNPKIKEVVCIFDGTKLIAFICPENESITEENLRAMAQEKLPIYMIPEKFIILQEFPLNSNGKIDRQKLLSLTTNFQNAQSNASETIKVCCEIFAKHLKISVLSPEDDIFQRGADSLKLLMAAQEFEDATGMKLDLATIFRVRTISKTLNLSVKLEPEITKRAVKVLKNTLHQLSHSQEHLWFLAKLNQDLPNLTNDAYILKFQIRRQNSIPMEKWEALAKFLVTKHPILRTQIVENFEGIPLQKVLEVDERLLQKMNSSQKIGIIDILSEPPLKFRIFPDLKIMEIGCHHIAIDGYSLGILIEDVEMFFKNSSAETPISDYQYFNFIQFQKLKNFSEELEFFEQGLSNVKNHDSRTDFPRSEGTNFKAGHYRTIMEIKNFQEILEEFQISETHFFLAIFALQQFSNPSTEDAIAIGMPFANRSLPFISTVGYFVNSHAVPILRPSTDNSFQNFVTNVRDTVLSTLSHSTVPFELVVRKLKPKREKGKTPFFQQMLIFEDLQNPKNFDGFEVIELDSNEAKLDQTWRIKRIENGKFEIHIEFMEALFKEEAIATAVQRFETLTKKILQENVAKIEDLMMLEVVDEIPEIYIDRIWKEILEIETADKDANFFEEGGHSLLAARLTSKINKKFGIKASINLLFEHQNLGEYIEEIKKLVTDSKITSISPLKIPLTMSPKTTPINPLQMTLLELLRKASEAGNQSLLEAYVNQIHIQIPEYADYDKINEALTCLIERHQILRTKFAYSKSEDGFDYQQETLDLETCAKFPILSLSTKLQTMNIFEEPVFRGFLDKSHRILTLEISHLVSDGHSMNILARDLHAIFINKPLPDLTVGYADFTSHFIKVAENQKTEYWSQMFQQNAVHSAIETDFVDKHLDYASDSVSKEFLNGNSALAITVKSHHCSPLAILLHSSAFRLREKLKDFDASLRIAICKDMRPSEAYFDSIGFYVNTLVIPIDAKDTIQNVEFKVSKAQKHSWITIDKLQKLATKIENVNFFDVMLVIDNSPVVPENQQLNGFRMMELKQNFTKFGLTIFVQTNAKNLNVKAEFRKSLWSPETIRILLNSWEGDGFGEKNLKIMPACKLPPKITTVFDQRDITSILMDVFQKFHHNIALKSESDEISYLQLKNNILQISSKIKEEYLKFTGSLFGPDTIIPVITNNSIEQWQICLGVIFAGGAYLPIDSKMPKKRIAKILGQLEPTLILSEIEISGFATISLTKFKSTKLEIESNFKISAKPENLAYIIFTSGTTGIPKGVCINRLGLSNLISDAQKFFSITSESVIYQFTNFCFDNSVLEVFAALGSGATCFIPDGIFTSDKFCRQISKYGITHAMLFPGLVETFDDEELAEMKKLKCWICGAEKLGKNLFHKAVNAGIQIVQNYGPTETTAYCLRKKLTNFNDDPQNLGAPIQNAIVSIRRPDGWEAMQGSKFELFISSIGLMRGYLGRKAEEQPFVTFGDGLKYYPSGDICKQLPSGEIQYIGRKDNQVKLHGFRIELEEIETCLLEFPSITSAKVLLNSKNEDIVAFYSSENAAIDKKELKDFLKQKLPHYMIPRNFVYLAEFPLTSNSKIDKEKLLEFAVMPKDEVKFSENSMESKIKEIWKKVLKLESQDFDLNDNFFYLGGNSLTSQKLINELKNSLKIEISMEQFYQNPTISSILEFSNEEILNINFLKNFEKIPLSFQQEQMLYLEQIDPESSYNLAFIQEFEKSINIEKLKSAFYKLLEENQEFRTIFKESDDGLEIYQEAIPPQQCFIEIKIEKYGNNDFEKIDLRNFKQRKFDLFTEIPIRVKILETSEAFVVLLIIHHAFSDATTTKLMESEISRIFHGIEKSANLNKISYQEYSIQQKSQKFQQKFQILIEEYLKEYGDYFKMPPLQIGTIFKITDFSQISKSYKFQLSTSNSNLTPFTLITAAILKSFLPLFPESGFLLLGCPFANRTPETAETFGNFLTNLLLPLTSKHQNLSLQDFQIELLKLSKYGEIPFQLLCKKLRNKSDIQIYLNCRYDLENEEDLDIFKEAKKAFSILTGLFEEVTNYPIEIDLDEKMPTLNSKKHYEITVRISKSFFEADEEKVGDILRNFEAEARKFFRGETNMLEIFARFLQIALMDSDDLEKSFIDLGGDSIMALKLRRALMKEIGFELDLRKLMASKSLKEILNPEMPSSNGDDVIEFYRNDKIDSGAVVILVYPLVGGCLIYSSLIKELKRNDKVYRIFGFHPPQILPKSMEELAKLHANQLSKIYNLFKFQTVTFIGASFGAALGYQISHEISKLNPSLFCELISIDGTLRTSSGSLPTYEAHKTKITNVVVSLSSEIEADNFNLDVEIESSWKLIQIAAAYNPMPLQKPFKFVLLHTLESSNLKSQWLSFIPEATVIAIEGNHETMLSLKNSQNIAKIIFTYF